MIYKETIVIYMCLISVAVIAKTFHTSYCNCYLAECLLNIWTYYKIYNYGKIKPSTLHKVMKSKSILKLNLIISAQSDII